MSKVPLTISALFLTGVMAFAAPVHPKAAPAQVEAAPLICPVTGDKIASVKEAAGSSTYKGKTYYFCCSSCKPEFDKNPAKYIKKTASTGAPVTSAAKM